MDDTFAELVDRGIYVEPPHSPEASNDFGTAWVVDPDGYRIELVQWPAGHPDGMTAADLTEQVASTARSHPRSVLTERSNKIEPGTPVVPPPIVSG